MSQLPDPRLAMGVVHTANAANTTGAVMGVYNPNVNQAPVQYYDPRTMQHIWMDPMGGSTRIDDLTLRGGLLQNGIMNLRDLLFARVYQARPELRPQPGERGGLRCLDYCDVCKSGEKVFVFVACKGQAVFLEDEKSELFPSDQLVSSLLVLLP